ncbi:MAG: Rieske (2Fe-2S) protein [Polyangiaceae bacterium]|nr:Rieske (2Fe-2S) protein [Polyangiaceae bacterium]
MQRLGRHAADTTTFDAARLASYPPPFPSGWYKVADSAELKAGGVLRVECAGEHLALFRDGDGQVCALEARCPHLGADLSAGVVKDGCLQCPLPPLALSRRRQRLPTSPIKSASRPCARAQLARARALGPGVRLPRPPGGRSRQASALRAARARGDQLRSLCVPGPPRVRRPAHALARVPRERARLGALQPAPQQDDDPVDTGPHALRRHRSPGALGHRSTRGARRPLRQPRHAEDLRQARAALVGHGSHDLHRTGRARRAPHPAAPGRRGAHPRDPHAHGSIDRPRRPPLVRRAKRPALAGLVRGRQLGLAAHRRPSNLGAKVVQPEAHGRRERRPGA